MRSKFLKLKGCKTAAHSVTGRCLERRKFLKYRRVREYMEFLEHRKSLEYKSIREHRRVRA